MGSADDKSRERLIIMGEIAAEVAHELRNVLQVISASAYVARHEVTGGSGSSALEHVVKIERNARLAHAIVDDLMGLAREEALHVEPVFVAEVVVAARSEFAPEAADWNDDVEPTNLRLSVHSGLVVRLLHVLYENAIQACAPRPPRVVTRARSSGDRVVVDIADDGPGVPPEIAARVFDTLVTARPGGTGLGLSLARRIATAHGGSITLVESPAGATFRLDLPGA